jgi:hypothetical protein
VRIASWMGVTVRRPAWAVLFMLLSPEFYRLGAVLLRSGFECEYGCNRFHCP